MSDVHRTAWRRQNREAYLEVKHALSEGKRLAEERDSNKMSDYEISATEQQLLEDVDTKNLQKRVDGTILRVDRTHSRGSLQG